MSDLTPDEVVNKTVDAVEKAASINGDGTITLSTGVILRIKPANPLALITVMAAFPMPRVPVYFDKTMGREMENPADPEYLSRIKNIETERASATLNALVLLGTELVSVPDGFSLPEEDEWLQEYRLLGLPVNGENKRWRYLKWIMFYAAPTAEDVKVIQDSVGSVSGVREEAVSAAETFSGRDKKNR